MSSSENGPEKTVNNFGNLKFGKWRLHQTSVKEDTWRKPVIDVTDAHIQLRRVIIDAQKRDFEYHIYFAGATYILRDSFKGFYPGYEDHDSVMTLGESWEAQAAIDRFLERLNKLKAFL